MGVQPAGLAIEPEQVARAPDRVGAVVEHGVVFHAVAGREDERLAHAVERGQAAGGGGEFGVGKGKTLPYLDLRGLVAQAEANDVHGAG